MMNTTYETYMNALKQGLASFDSAAAEEILNDFESHFADARSQGLSDEEICAELGNVDDVLEFFRQEYATTEQPVANVLPPGLGYGDNARAALITRGIAELARLGVAMGCNVHTFAGLAGIGDLIVTATSMHSRNNRAGILIGKGETPEQAVKEVGMVVEGMNALPAALELAAKYQVEMPIVQTVNAVVNKGMSAAEAVRSLMDRDPKNELPQDYEK